MLSLGHRSFFSKLLKLNALAVSGFTFILHRLLYALFHERINSRGLWPVQVFIHGHQKSVVVLLLCALGSMGLRRQGCAQVLKFFQGVGSLLRLLLQLLWRLLLLLLLLFRIPWFTIRQLVEC